MGFFPCVLRVLCGGEVLLALAVTSCGAPLMKLPAGPGAPATDAADAFAQATSVCRGIRTLTAEVAASGNVGGQRFRVRLSAGVEAPASARLEAVAPFGAPFFIFVATNDDATLFLPRDERVLEHGRPADVLDAVAGVPLSASDLHAVLTGCTPAVSQPEGRALGADWRMITEADGDAIYLRRDAAAWQLAAIVHRAWRVDYRDQLNGLPRTLRITSVPRDGSASFDLTLALTQVETNIALDAEVFRVQVPRTAQSITLDELRHARPGVRKN